MICMLKYHLKCWGFSLRKKFKFLGTLIFEKEKFRKLSFSFILYWKAVFFPHPLKFRLSLIPPPLVREAHLNFCPNFSGWTVVDVHFFESGRHTNCAYQAVKPSVYVCQHQWRHFSFQIKLFQQITRRKHSIYRHIYSNN